MDSEIYKKAENTLNDVIIKAAINAEDGGEVYARIVDLKYEIMRLQDMLKKEYEKSDVDEQDALRGLNDAFHNIQNMLTEVERGTKAQ